MRVYIYIYIYIDTFIYILEALRASLSVYRFGRCFGVVNVPVIYIYIFPEHFYLTPNRKNNDKNGFFDPKNIRKVWL